MNFRRDLTALPLCIAAAATIFLLFAQPEACRAAAAEALALCGGPLLTGIFPFLIVSGLIVGSGCAPLLALPLRPAARLLGCRSASAAAVLLIGGLGGFAPAASAAAGLYRRGELDADEAGLLLAAAVGSSPSFVMLSVGQGMLGSLAIGARLYLCQLAAAYLAALLYARLQPRGRRPRRQPPQRSRATGAAGGSAPAGRPQPAGMDAGRPVPANAQSAAPPPASSSGQPPVTLASVIGDGAIAYIRLCGFIVYFRILAGGAAAFLPARLAFLPALLLEVSSGCSLAAAIPHFGPYLCCAALSLQGLSVLLQVRSICPAGLPLGPLLAVRPLHLCLSLGLFCLSLQSRQAQAVYSSLEQRVIALPRMPLPCILLLFALCLLVCSRLCRALQAAQKQL